MPNYASNVCRTGAGTGRCRAGRHVAKPRADRQPGARVNVDYTDRGLALAVYIVANDVGAATREGYTTSYRFKGRYLDASFGGHALTGSAPNFNDATAKLPVRGRLVASTTTLDVEGSITDMMPPKKAG
jgi:hypothetical protein